MAAPPSPSLVCIPATSVAGGAALSYDQLAEVDPAGWAFGGSCHARRLALESYWRCLRPPGSLARGRWAALTRWELRAMVAGLGHTVPDDFPRVAYNEIGRRVHTFVAQNPAGTSSLDHFWDSWLAGAYRFCACAEHDAAFRASVQRAGSNPRQPEHYVQERELFGFFVCGLTALESFAYSSYALAAILDDKKFPMANPRAIQLDSTADRMVKRFPGEALSMELDQIRNDNDYRGWAGIRNVLAHRLIPARQITVTLWPPQADPTPEVTWMEDSITLNSNTTTLRREWLAKVVTQLVHAVDCFTLSHFSIRGSDIK